MARNIFVFLGDMLELGERAEQLHREVGTYAASKDIDRLVFIGSLSQNSLLAAKEAAREKEILYFSNVEDFRKSARISTRAGETILIKASRNMAFENVRSVFPKGIEWRL